MIDPAIVWLISIAGAALFAIAAAHKLQAPRAFAATLAEYRLLPERLVPAVAACVIVLEATASLGLLALQIEGPMGPANFLQGSRDSAGALLRLAVPLIAGGLLLLYAAAMGINLLRGRREIDCGCTLRRQSIGGWMVARNVLLAAILLSLVLPPSSRALGWADAAMIAAALLISTLLYLSLDQLLGRTEPARPYSTETL